MGKKQVQYNHVGQILEKYCVCSRGHIFSPILMKLGLNVSLIDVFDEIEKGSCYMSKTRSLGQILGKHCVCFRGHIFLSNTPGSRLQCFL